MSMRKDLDKDLIALLTKAILANNEDVPHRLSAQEEALKELRCADPQLGKWIAVCDFPFLIETLVLSDGVFSQEFPGVELVAEERKRFANMLEAHCEICAHCHLKRAYDLELQSRVDTAFAENRQEIGEAIAFAAGKK